MDRTGENGSQSPAQPAHNRRARMDPKAGLASGGWRRVTGGGRRHYNRVGLAESFFRTLRATRGCHQLRSHASERAVYAVSAACARRSIANARAASANAADPDRGEVGSTRTFIDWPTCDSGSVRAYLGLDPGRRRITAAGPCFSEGRQPEPRRTQRSDRARRQCRRPQHSS